MEDDNNDDYTNVFGVGSELGGASLFLGFCCVATYLLIFSGFLNKLEAITLGTSYHLVLQRLYREIMMVGMGSFAFTILNQTQTKLPYGMSDAIGFADICCFTMASFFCLQGVFIMIASVKQARNWNVASQIPAEELLHNMSEWESTHPLTWRLRYLPFCPTREQVEFRVLKSIFATAYNLKTSHLEFGFGIFLCMSHEKNIVEIIDISLKNWLYILVLTACAAMKLNFWESSCQTESCEIQEDVTIFAVCGSLYGLLSVVVWLWGRRLELRLLASAGVEHIDDYSIFLMTEFRTEENLANVVTSPDLAKEVIQSFMRQKETLEVAAREEQFLRRQQHVPFFGRREKVKDSGGSVACKYMAEEGGGLCVGEAAGEDDVTNVEGSQEGGEGEEEDDIFAQESLPEEPRGGSGKGPKQWSILSKSTVCPDTPSDDIFDDSTDARSSAGSDSRNNSGSDHGENRRVLQKLPSHDNKLTDRGMSMIVKRNKKNLFRLSSGQKEIKSKPFSLLAVVAFDACRPFRGSVSEDDGAGATGE